MIKKFFSLDILLLLGISALVYLPYAIKLTYYLDDWYYIYDGYVGGANIFHSMFSIDRPARGYFFDLYFSWFGPHPLPYHIGVFVWRVMASICVLWLCKILWNQDGKVAFFVALLFTLYPGYAWWVSAIEYQPMIASLCLQVFSIVMTLRAIEETKFTIKVIYIIASVLTGWSYIALVDYAIGMEVFRFLCVYLLVSNRWQSLSVAEKFFKTMKAWSWNILIPAGFIFWRLVLFENQRKATDIGSQISKFQDAPITYLIELYYNLLFSVGNVGLFAWFRQFHMRFLEAGSKLSDFGLLITCSILLILFILRKRLSHLLHNGVSGTSSVFAKQAIPLGLVSLIFGVLPVVFANRSVNLSNFSHYGLPVSLASAVLLVGALHLFLSSDWKLDIAVGALVAMSALTHSMIAEKTLLLENSMEVFWWQASWRIPDLRPDTTIVTLYPYDQVVDNELGLPYPVNLIYFSERQTQIPIRLPVSTLMPSGGNVKLILTSAEKKTNQYRVHKSIINYRNIVILMQSTPESCVRVIDGNNYILSEFESKIIGDIAPHSKIENIRTQFDFSVPQEFAFGPEPEHGWCYYFEKADFAVQTRDWETASNMGDIAISLGLFPVNQVEWYPLIQAYAMTGNEDKLEMIESRIASNTDFKHQVCEKMLQPTEQLSLKQPNIKLLESLFCA